MSRVVRVRIFFRRFVLTFVFVFVVVPGGIGTIVCLAQTSSSAATDDESQSRAQSAGPLASSVTAASGQPTSIPASPDAAPALRDPVGEANSLYRKGDWDGALEKYEALVRERPNAPDGAAGIARVYLKQKKIEAAARSITQAIAASNSPALHVVLGEVLFRQGKITEAEKEWVSVINSGNPAPRAYLGLARVRDVIGMHKTAKLMIDKAHALDDQDPEIQKYWIGTLPRSERIKYFEDYLAGPNNSDADEVDRLRTYLAYLKERAKQPGRPCRMVSKVTATQTSLVRLLLDPSHLRGYGLSLALNGAKTNLMLDTGASGITINRRVAERAGITKLTETRIWGIGDKGARHGYIGTANSIRIGDLEFHDCPVEVMESRSVADEEGLIGADVFSDFLVEIDFPKEKLRLSELPKRPGEAEQQPSLNEGEDEDGGEAENVDKPGSTGDAAAKTSTPAPRSRGPQDRYIAPEMHSYTRIFRFGHDLLVPTRIGDAPQKLFLLDTGAFTNSISPAAAREVTKVHGDSDVIVKGISGSIKNVYSANKAVLQFGNLRQENQDMLAFDTTAISESNGTEVSGFLGFTLLRFLDIKIDYRDGLIDFNYDPKAFN